MGLCVFVGDELFYFPPCNRFLRDETLQPLLLYSYFHGECSDEQHSFVSPVLTFAFKARHAIHIVANHPHPLRIPLGICKFHSSSFYPRNTVLWNRLPSSFTDHYNLNSFKSRVNRYLQHLPACILPLNL